MTHPPRHPPIKAPNDENDEPLHALLMGYFAIFGLPVFALYFLISNLVELPNMR
jgi:hypothetical protein